MISASDAPATIRPNGLRPIGLGQQHGPVGRVIVPLDQCRHRSRPGQHIGMKCPDRIRDRCALRIDQQRTGWQRLFRMAAQMNLACGCKRKLCQTETRIGAVIGGADKDVVHVLRQDAAGAPHDFG